MADVPARDELTIDVPTGYGVTPVPGGRRGGRLPSGPVPLGVAGATDPVVAALQQQGLVQVGPPQQLAATTARRRGTARVQVTVAADEDAVVLLEQDGVYTWQHPSRRSEPELPGGTRSPLASRSATRQVVFEVSLVPSEAAERRGLLQDLAFARVRVVVFKFLARAITGKVIRHLEAHITPRLVRIADPDPLGWQPLGQLPELPADRPARVLLFVHGTFSSTAGGFGSLGGHDAGRALLAQAVQGYDLVIGYDHLTLSLDPSENAAELMSMLRALPWPVQPVFDVVTHSRGALVTRSFVEQALPQSGWAATVDRIVFAAGTNAGTLFAKPGNWDRLLDLYTNLAAAAARLLPEQLAATILSEAIKGLGALAKFLVAYSITDGGVPGLAAMEPDGKFVQDLNRSQPGQPLPGTTPWYVLGANFEPKLRGPSAPALPARLLAMLADGLVDQLMGEPNDLVVNTASMAAIDSPVGTASGFVRARYDFPAEAGVFHTVYFQQEATAEYLFDWLQLSAPVASAPPPAPDPVPRGTATGATRRPVKVPARKAPVRRGSAGKVPTITVPTRKMPTITVSPGMVFDGLPGPFEATRAVRRESYTAAVLRERGPTGSFPNTGMVLIPDLVGKLRQPAAPARTGGRRAAGGRGAGTARSTGAGTARSTGGRAARATGRTAHPAAGGPPAPPTVAYFRAAMAEQAVVGQVASVRCTVGREQLEKLAGAATAQGPVAEDKPITVQLVVKAHAEVVGDDRADIAVPNPGEPVDLYFDVRPLAKGEGELHVVARQGPIPLVTLVLKPTFVTGRVRKGAGTIGAAADEVPASAPDTCVKHWLRITERTIGTQTVYDFDLQADDLKLLCSGTSAPLVGDRAQYVARLYQRIEDRAVSSQADAAAFARELRALGGELFDELIPQAIGKALWEHREQLQNVLVLSDEPFIPWELVHLKNGRTLPKDSWFLAQLGTMRWLQGTYPPDVLARARTRYVVPDYPARSGLQLPATAAEATFLSDQLGGEAVPADSASVLDLLSEPGSFDLLHFAGHGEAENGSARILLTGRIEGDSYLPDSLFESTVNQYAALRAEDGSRPMVVLNACQAGQLAPQLTHVGGFAHAFIQNGAGAFVGALWSIGDQPASAFCQELYRALLAGKTLAEASLQARQAARRDGGEATWLAYVVYGNPCARWA